jgi:selenide, water dikinase
VGPGDLREMMAGLDQPPDPALLVGTETSDDAGVVRIAADAAIVCTADFITPVADDPFLFGQVAAANALSDVYAMGGRPVAAVALCMFPKALEPEAAHAILDGGQKKVNEAGALVVGGHTVRSPELLYGLSVTGLVEPDRVWRNAGARVGDALVLTKPLGSGLILNGYRKGAIDDAGVRAVCAELAVLNRAAADALRDAGARVHAVTDVTGFGLVGHAHHMAVGARVGVRFHTAAIPAYARARDMFVAGVKTGSTAPNRDGAAARVRWRRAHDPFLDDLVHDPQTSGGLLAAVDGDAAAALIESLHARGVTHARVIGEVVAPDQGGGAFIELT